MTLYEQSYVDKLWAERDQARAALAAAEQRAEHAERQTQELREVVEHKREVQAHRWQLFQQEQARREAAERERDGFLLKCQAWRGRAQALREALEPFALDFWDTGSPARYLADSEMQVFPEHTFAVYTSAMERAREALATTVPPEPAAQEEE